MGCFHTLPIFHFCSGGYPQRYPCATHWFGVVCDLTHEPPKNYFEVSRMRITTQNGGALANHHCKGFGFFFGKFYWFKRIFCAQVEVGGSGHYMCSLDPTLLKISPRFPEILVLEVWKFFGHHGNRHGALSRLDWWNFLPNLCRNTMCSLQKDMCFWGKMTDFMFPHNTALPFLGRVSCLCIWAHTPLG